MIDRFEKVLHIHYGQVEYWKVICLQTIKLRSSDLGSLTHYSQTVTRIQPVYKLQGAIWTKSQERMGLEHQNAADFKSKN